MTTKEQSCEARIAGNLKSRVQDFKVLEAASNGDGISDSERFSGLVGYEPGEDHEADISAAQEALWEYPLAVSVSKVFRIELSTGGPADWLEVHLDEPAQEITRIVYHFSDWFDHAERTLEGDEFKAAAEFALNFISELQ